MNAEPGKVLSPRWRSRSKAERRRRELAQQVERRWLADGYRLAPVDADEPATVASGGGDGEAARPADRAGQRGGGDALELVAAALEAAGIPYLVVPVPDPARFRVGVPEAYRQPALRALRSRGDASLTALDGQGRGGEVTAAAAMRRPGREARQAALRAPAWRVHRAVGGGDAEPAEAAGCDVEFWPPPPGGASHPLRRRHGDAPARASRTAPRGSTAARGSATIGEARVAGRSYPAVTPAVAKPRFDDVTFPIDLVYTWVDDADPEWVAAKDALLRRLDLDDRSADAHDPARYRDHDELRYSLRSVAECAAFVRHVFIVTDGQVPSWLDTDHERVTVVDHRDIFPDASYLPTFNSHAIESRLHHIPGLAEHYLYVNDDFFFARPVAPEQFFHGNGMTKFFVSPAEIPGWEGASATRSVDAAAANTRRVVHQRFGRVVDHKLKHAPYPQRRSVLYEMEEVLTEEFARTTASRIRAPDDVAVPSSLAPYYAYLTGRAVPARIASRYVSLDQRGLSRRLRSLRRRRDFDVLCVNDSGRARRDGRRARALAEFMAARWPDESPFER